MKKYLAVLLCVASCSVIAAQGNAPALSQEQIDAFKASAARISNVTQTRSPVITENGEIQRDEKTGKAVENAPGTASMADKGRYLSTITGVSGYQNQAEPGRGGTAAATVTGSSFADFSCAIKSTTQKTILGRVLRFSGCSHDAAGSISTVTLSLCSVSLNGGACGPQDYTQPQPYQVGAYAKLDGLNVGVGCNESNKTCRITIDDSYSVAGNGQQLTSQAAEKAASSGENSAQGSITKTYTSDQYAEKLAGTATEVDACAGAAQESAGKTGVVATCGKDKQIASVSTQPAKTNCSDTPVCIRRATRSVSYGQTCARTFPLTGYSCNFNIPKFECTVTKDVKSGTLTNSCSDADLLRANKVKSTQDKVTCSASDASGTCTTENWTDYYTKPEKATLDGGCSASPFPLSGNAAEACLNHGTGSATTCRDGGWWLRTLSDSECTVIRTDNVGGGNTTETITHLTNAEKPGCGICVNTTTNDTCYAAPTAAEPADTCANIDFNACTLTSSSPESQFNGMTLSQKEVYTCQKQEDSCVEYDRSNMCSSFNMAFGQDKETHTQTTTNGAMNRAMTDAAVIDAINQGTEEGSDPMVPHIFSGNDMRCSKPVGWFSGISSNDCCRLSLDRPGGSGIQNKCSLNEVKLATARRSNLTTYIGEYCSKTSGWGPTKHCTTRTQTYCSFRGILPRVIQTQGREQLAQLSTSSAAGTIEKAALNFQFYSGNGGWMPTTTVNGVVMSTWQYPSYCASAEKMNAALDADPNAKECPLALTQWFAVCENPQGCGALPAAPELGSERWNLTTVNPLKNITSAISRYALITGACDPASTNCHYDVAAWPNGIGGKAIASKDMSFPLFSEQAQSAKALSGIPQDITSLGDFIFRPNSVPGVANPNGAMPASIMLDFSLNGGTSYGHVALPTHTTGTDFAIPDASDIRVSGGCDLASNICNYKITGTVSVTAKPWGSPQNPDCTGFTIGQLSVLDFSKMDLSEWIASVTGKLQGQGAANLSEVAATRTQQMLDARKASSATMTATNPTAVQAARITPHEDFGPFVATLRVSGNWPVFYDDASKNNDPVTRVEVDWGDCTMPEAADPANEFVNGMPSSGFLSRHQYGAPDQVPAACDGGRHNLVHLAKVRIYSQSGIHNLTVKVNNAWNSFTNEGGSGGGTVNATTTVAAPKK